MKFTVVARFDVQYPGEYAISLGEIALGEAAFDSAVFTKEFYISFAPFPGLTLGGHEVESVEWIEHQDYEAGGFFRVLMKSLATRNVDFVPKLLREKWWRETDETGSRPESP